MVQVIQKLYNYYNNLWITTFQKLSLNRVLQFPKYSTHYRMLKIKNIVFLHFKKNIGTLFTINILKNTNEITSKIYLYNISIYFIIGNLTLK